MTELTVKNRHAVWALAIAAAIFGTLAYFKLPMQLFPDTSPPVVTTITAWPGASAEDVAENLSRPLEEEFSGMEGAAKVSSSSQDNLSLVTVEFQYDRDLDIAAVDTQNAVARIRESLPGAIKEPQVLKIDTSDRPVITLGVGAEDLVEVRRKAEDVFAPRLQRIDGVAAVDVFGGAQDAVIVEIEPSKLEAYRIPFFRVVQTIENHDAAMPAGSLRTERSRTSFRVEARASNLEELGQIPFLTPDGSRVRLGDLAEIRRGSLDDDARYAVDGQRAIAVQVYKTTDANTVDVVSRVEEVLDEWDAQYSEIDFLIGDEDASFTEQSISNLLSNVWQALLLASIIIFLFIGRVRASLVAVVSMPLSYGITFALMQAAGVEFNMVTLSAVILAVGMVVDASVVVLENIARRRDEDGLSAEQAAIEGTDEVRLAVLAGVASTVIVLIPLIFLTGFVGKTFGPLALTLLFAFVSSVAVALVLVPVLTIYTGGRSRLDDIGTKIASPFGWLMDKLQGVYLTTLRGSLRFRLVALLVALATFVAGVVLVKNQGMDVLPKMDGGSFFVSLETPSGSSVSETEGVVRRVEAILADEPEVVKVQSQVGFEQGMKSFSSTGAQGPTQGFITVALSPRTEREESIWSIENRVREELKKVPGIRTATVRELGNTAKSTTAAPVVVRVSGDDPLVLDRLGDEVIERISAVDGVVQPVRNWRIDQKRVEVDVDSIRAGQIGLAPVGVAQQMQAGSDGVDAGEYYGDQSATPPIRVRFDRDRLEQPDDLLDFPVFTPDTAEPTPLRSVASLRETTGQALATRENFLPTLEITAFTEGRALSFITAEVEDSLEGFEVPQGYEVVAAGEADDLGEARSKLGGAFAISLIAVYLLLVAQLRSFMHPITIMGAVPLSLSGVGIALWVADKPVSMPVMVGLILLVGTVVNNAILLIDFIRQARDRGSERQAALESAVASRFRPIMMTAMSTIVGMIPLASEWALGAERFSPLAVAVIGGLSAATFLTMIIIPVVYDVFEDIGEGLRGLFARIGNGGQGATGTLVVLLAAVGAMGALGVLPGTASTAYADETLRLDVAEAVEMAREHSFALEARQDEVGAARARSKQARGRLLPRVDVQARAAKLSDVEPGTLELPSAQPGAEPPDVQFGEEISETVSFRAQINQPIFAGGGLIDGWDAAELGVDLAESRERQEFEDLRLQVEQIYFSLYQARQMSEVAEQSVELLEEHRDRITRLHEAGRATRLDVSRVQARLADAQVGIEEARGGARSAELSLQTLLGLSADTELVLSEDPLPNESELGESDVEGTSLAKTDTLTETALAHRPELEVARRGVDVQQKRAEALQGALWPQLFLQAGYTLANPHERYFPPRDEFNDSWDISLNLSWAAWDWGVNYYGMKEAEHQAMASRRSVERLEDFTRLEIERQRTEVDTALRRTRAARASVDTSRKALQDAVTLFEAGRLSSTEVLETEVELTQARSRLVQAQVQARTAAAELRRLVGAPP
ncbi:MAG: efflux RND transporter permease subunit [Persicimonas sp.]